MSIRNLPIQLRIDDSFFDEEIRNDYLISAQMKKIWAVELDLLNQFIDVCEKYNLEYHVTAGTLLGAIRHKGIIPWDDDIDVQMPRKDYDKLLSIADQAFTKPYFLQTEYSDPGYSKAFAKLRNSETTGIPINDIHCDLHYNQGIFIDVFPLDNLPDEEVERQYFIDELNSANTKIRRFFRLTYGNNEQSKHNNALIRLYKKTVGACLKKFFDLTKIKNPFVKRFDNISTRYNKVNTKDCGIFVLYNFKRFAWEREDLESTIPYPFEMLTVRVPKNYEKVLEKTYGDWHKMVKGGAVHQETMFDTDTPYLESPLR